MRVILFALLMLLGTSCIRSEQQAKIRVAQIVKRFPSVIDTTTKERVVTRIEKDTVSQLDTAKLQWAIHIVCDTDTIVQKEEAIKWLHDNCDTKIITKSVYKDRYITKTIPVPCPEVKPPTLWEITKQYYGLGLFLLAVGVVIGWLLRRL